MISLLSRSVRFIVFASVPLAAAVGCSSPEPGVLGTPPIASSSPTSTSVSPPTSEPTEEAGQDCGGKATSLVVDGKGRNLTARVTMCRDLSGGAEYWVVAEPIGADGAPSGQHYPKGKAGESGTGKVSITLGPQTDRPSSRYFYVVMVPADSVRKMVDLLANDTDADTDRDELPPGVEIASSEVKSTYE